MFYGRLFIKKENLGEDSMEFMGDKPTNLAHHDELNKVQYSSADADLVISATSKDFKNCEHYPVLDIDVSMNIVPASRVGHSHLYFNVPMTQEQLFKLLDVMAEVGIVETGYRDAAKARGYSAVRLPWIKKEDMIK